MTTTEARFRANAIVRDSKADGADFEKLASDELRFYRDTFAAILAEADSATRVVDFATQALRVARLEFPRW